MRPTASLSLDLDNQWSYMKTRGDDGWKSFPTYLDLVVSRVLSFFREREQRITVFVVGQDAALDKNREALAALSAAGHDIGNHSFHHEPWLHRRDEGEVEDEIARAEDSIERSTGVHVRGFRGPGYSLSAAVLRVLTRRGYAYDASTLPTYIGSLARTWYFATARLSKSERQERRELFGSFSDGLRPLHPYYCDLGEDRLLEIPVTTMPLLRTPFHFSYVLYLSRFSASLARGYWRAALAACRLRGVAPSLLLHPLDFMCREDVPALAFFPAMDLPSEVKLQRISSYLDDLAKHFTVKPLGEHARELRSRSDLRSLPPRFPSRGSLA